MIKNRNFVFNLLITIAIVSGIFFDLLGYNGFFYNRYPPEVFWSISRGAIISHQVHMIVYLFITVLYYLSLILFFLRIKFAIYIAIIGFAAQIFLSMTTGIQISTPPEMVLDWIGTFSYVSVFSIAIFSDFFKKP